MSTRFHVHLPNPAAAVSRLADARPPRVLVAGATGVGKSSLVDAAAARLGADGQRIAALSADPGSPAFGVPGAVALAESANGQWRLQGMEPLCSLDAARFRLPLAGAVGRLLSQWHDGMLLLDAPGLLRGVAGAELIQALGEMLRPQVLLWLSSEGQAPKVLTHELEAMDAERWLVTASPQAARPGPQARARGRTALWDSHLEGAVAWRLPLSQLALLGTPPPVDVPAAWSGRQVACRDRAGDWVFGEVLTLEGAELELRLAGALESPEQLLVRDAGRDRDGWLGTVARVSPATARVPPPERTPPGAEVGAASVSVVNGVFGDPLVHLRLRHRRRSLLFDVGDCRHLPTRVLHQVTDVFISHAHADHIGGFMGLLRARIGFGGPCRVYGPRGLAWNVEGFVRGILWDRIGPDAPVFQVTELHEDMLHHFRVEAGVRGPQAQGRTAAGDGVVLTEPDFRVRAVTLDHGTPVLAYAFEPRGQANVRKERLAASGLSPGPWLTRLKRLWLAGDDAAVVDLPDGTSRTVAVLARALLKASPGRRVVYATDLADNPANRERLSALARDAHTLVCEAAFTEQDGGQARYTGHLTARACGEIAAAAGVRQLIPFHFSPRYEGDPARVYREVAAVCPGGISLRR